MVREEYYVSVVEFKDEKNSESQVDMFISFFFFLSSKEKLIPSGNSSEIFYVYLERARRNSSCADSFECDSSSGWGGGPLDRRFCANEHRLSWCERGESAFSWQQIIRFIPTIQEAHRIGNSRRRALSTAMGTHTMVLYRCWSRRLLYSAVCRELF